MTELKDFENLFTRSSYIIIFSIFVSLYFLNSFNFALLKVKGDFKAYSLQLFVNTLIGFVLLIFLIKYAGVLSVLLSGILYIPISNWYISREINLKKNDSNQLPKLSLPQNSFSFLLALGHSTFIGFWGKVFLGFDNGLDINYYHYAFILIHSFQSLIVVNLTSLLLYKLSSDSSEFKDKYIYMLTISLPIIFVFFFYFGGGLMVELLFEHGKFNSSDSNIVIYFLHYYLMIPFALLCSSQVFLQPLLSNKKGGTTRLKDVTIKSISLLLFIFVIFSLLSKFLLNLNNHQILVIFLYGSSISILIITYISFKKYSFINVQA